MSEPLRPAERAEARARLSEAELRFERRRRTVGLFAGPLGFALLLLLPPAGLAPSAARLAAVVVWVLCWWMTEAVPLPVTALLGPALAVVLGVGDAKQMFAPFGNPIIFLFLGSFLLAEAMSATALDRRFAYAILSSQKVGSSTGRILCAFGVVAAGLSMWLSNTATAAMMYPIAMSVLAALSRLLSSEANQVDLTSLRYGRGLLLTTAYACSIGGLATPVGTPPNLIAIGQLKALAGVQISFFQWMLVGTPLAVLLLAVLLLYFRWAVPAEVSEIDGGAEQVSTERAALGGWTRAQRNVLLAFLITVSLWVLPGVLALAVGTKAPLYLTVKRCLPEGVVALLGAGLLFVLPVSWSERRFTLNWSNAGRIDWGTLLLFGGGLSLGEAMFSTGLAQSIGQGMIQTTGVGSSLALSYLFAALSLLMTETTSNTAAATTVCPLAIAAAQAVGVSPVAPVVSCALVSSAAFLLPVSTPPNAIVYGSGCVPITAMLRHGGLLDLATLAITPGATLLLCRLLGLN